MNLYDKVAIHCCETGLPIGAEAVRQVERFLKEERRLAAYDRAGLPIVRPSDPVLPAIRTMLENGVIHGISAASEGILNPGPAPLSARPDPREWR